jgi:hypothetical protein
VSSAPCVSLVARLGVGITTEERYRDLRKPKRPTSYQQYRPAVERDPTTHEVSWGSLCCVKMREDLEELGLLKPHEHLEDIGSAFR